MKPTTPDRIRNVALISHGGAGKTSLAEAMLFDAGATVGDEGDIPDFVGVGRLHRCSLDIQCRRCRGRRLRLGAVEGRLGR